MARLFNIDFSEISEARLIEIIRGMIRERKPCYIVTPNLNYARLAHGDEGFRSVLADADLRLCDSAIISMMLTISGQALPARLTGSDLTSRLLRIAEAEGIRVYLLGSDMPTLKKVQGIYPTAVCGMGSPPIHERPWELDDLNETYLKDMHEARPDILFLAMGAKKQEFWARKYLVKAGVPVVLCIGASLDFIAGRVMRSPRLISRMGFEWLWRLMTEPWRLWRRYSSDALFLLRRGAFELFKASFQTWRRGDSP